MIENTCEDRGTQKCGNRTTRWWTVLSCGWTLLGLLLASSALSQTDEMDRAAELDIEELIAIGGRPVGPWPVGGLTWPLEELRQRPRDEVVEAAMDCLEDPAPQQNNHSFCAYLLTSYNVPHLFRFVTEHFDGMNHLGQFEFLLQGYYANDPRYASLFTTAVEASMEMPPPNRVATLAALYAAHHYHPRLLTALSDYHQRHQGPIDRSEHRIGLNGFPYSDVVTLTARINEALPEALAFGNGMASIADTQMTPAEQSRLTDLRATLLDTSHADLPVQTRTLGELIDTLDRVFPGQSFQLADPDGDLASLYTEIGGTDLTATDVLATLCNDYRLQVDDSGRPTGWRIRNPRRRGVLGSTDYCAAHGNFLVTLSIRRRSDNRFYSTTTLHNPGGWPRFGRSHFSLQGVTVRQGPEVEHGKALSPISGIPAFHLSDMDIGSTTVLDVRGIVSAGIPAKVHILEQRIVPGVDEMELGYGPFRLEMQNDDESFRVHWGVPGSCCRRLSTGPIETYNSGVVALFDTDGNMVSQRGATRDFRQSLHTGTDLAHEELRNVLYFRKNQSGYARPARLVWILIPEMETFRLDVEFTDIQIDTPARP